jgi:hypothetical protein
MTSDTGSYYTTLCQVHCFWRTISNSRESPTHYAISLRIAVVLIATPQLNPIWNVDPKLATSTDYVWPRKAVTLSILVFQMIPLTPVATTLLYVKTLFWRTIHKYFRELPTIHIAQTPLPHRDPRRPRNLTLRSTSTTTLLNRQLNCWILKLATSTDCCMAGKPFTLSILVFKWFPDTEGHIT